MMGARSNVIYPPLVWPQYGLRGYRATGVPDSKRLTAHSLRHTLSESLKCAGIADRVIDRIMGHASGSVAARYGSPALRLAESRDAITAAIAKLGDVDDSIYSENERLTDPS